MPAKVESLSPNGLLPRERLKIHAASSEAGGNNRKAVDAIDGNPRTHWHTSYTPEVLKHPHELVIDLGGNATVRGIRYLARQDSGWNGALAKCEVSVAASPESFGEPVATTTFTKRKQSQELLFEPVEARYLRLRVLSEVNGGPWASISELGVVGEGLEQAVRQADR
jgi:endo-alpha-N-acetylgalactosaminidase